MKNCNIQTAQEMKNRRHPTLLLSVVGAAALFCQSGMAQFDPDPRIFEGEANGAGPNSGSNQSRSGRPSISAGGIPIGGDVSILDESTLPPLGTIDILGGTGLNIPISTPGMPGGMQGGITRGSSGSSGMPIPMGGRSPGGGQQGQSSMGLPPKGGSSGGQQGQSSSGIPPMSSSRSQGSRDSQSNNTPLIPMLPSNAGQQGQQGQMEQMGSNGEQGEQSQRGQSGLGGQAGESPLGQLPPPPPDIQIGSTSDQIGGPIGDLTGDDPDTRTSDGATDSESRDQNKANNVGESGGDNGKKVTESDGQQVGGGGSQGSNRAKGTEEGGKMSSNL